MHHRHSDRKLYFREQATTTKQYVIPYIEELVPINSSTRVLEIGCGEGGNLAPFIERQCEVVGVDINEDQIENAKAFINEQFPDNKARLLYKNIYDVTAEDIGTFDVIMLRDVIEHIPDQAKFMAHLKTFLKPQGVTFFGFPPWCMPFGGHQQICSSKFVSRLPYFHILPKPLYRGVLRLFGETEGTIGGLMEIKDTGISINRFHRIVRQNGFRIDKRTFYLINPNYNTKFGLKPREQFGLIRSIPVFRDFLTTCYYCIISKADVLPGAQK